MVAPTQTQAEAEVAPTQTQAEGDGMPHLENDDGTRWLPAPGASVKVIDTDLGQQGAFAHKVVREGLGFRV
jgi:hypothetical protein